MNHSRTAKRIGFVDFRLDNFHADVLLDAIRGPLAGRGFEVAGAWALMDEPSRAWSQRREVAYFTDLAALDACVDCYMILAPSNPETHLDLCQRILPRAKPTYVDKTFAPTADEAERIFALADQCRAPVQTSSALRYANVVAEIESMNPPVRRLAVWGGGTSFGEYAIHPVELAVAVMGTDAVAVAADKCGGHWMISVRFGDERSATIHVNCDAHVPYLAAATTDAGTAVLHVDDSRLFVDAAAAVLDFLESGAPVVNRAETMLVRTILDLAADESRLGGWTRLDGDARGPIVPRPKFADRAALRGEPTSK